MEIINLNNLIGIPKEYLQELQKYRKIFQRKDHLDDLLENAPIMALVKTIDEFCTRTHIIGFHYTRAIQEEIVLGGLICRTGDEIRNDFSSKYGHIFTESETQIFKNRWADYFNKEQKKLRDNRLFFNFTTFALKNRGAEPLLSKFGGEQIHRPLQDLQDIGTKINEIGQPLVLKCVLDPSNLTTFTEYPWGKITVSSYHCNINPIASQFDQDGHQNYPVSPNAIEIINYDVLGKYKDL